MNQMQIVDVLKKWLDNDDWNYDYNAEKHSFLMRASINSLKLKTAQILITVNDDNYNVFCYSSIGGVTYNLTELIKYLTMVNYGLIDGNFELDVRDGEIRYKTYVNCKGMETISSEVISDSIYVACSMLGRYGDGIVALALGFSDADTEIKKTDNNIYGQQPSEK